MNDFNRSNKVTGVHWLRTPINKLQICIKLKPKDGILSLPKFEDYANDSYNSVKPAPNLTHHPQVDEYTFKWQEKVFSLWEIQRYSEIHNCSSETEQMFHEMIKGDECSPSRVSTHIHEDFYLPLPFDSKMKESSSVLKLKSFFEKLTMTDWEVFHSSNSSMRHLFKSEENIFVDSEQWTAMHVVFDNSEYNNDFQLLLKQESTLLSIFHNSSQNYMIISPDINDLDLNPYLVEMGGEPCGYEYAVDIGLREVGSEDDLVVLLSKVYKKWQKKQKFVVNFVMPPPGRKCYFVTLEILRAIDFEMDNLYVEFEIKIPESIQCTDALHGRTHVSKAFIDQEGKEKWCFGHIIELMLEADSRLDLPPLQLFFEVISKDWWGRHRTEGYSYHPLTLHPGHYKKQLSCSRPEEEDRVEAETRRFFVGGCHLIKDLDVLAKPQLMDANFKFVSTGTLEVSYNVISQGHNTDVWSPSSLPSRSSARGLLLGAEAALRQYSKARAKLAAATKEIRVTHTKRRGERGAGDT